MVGVGPDWTYAAGGKGKIGGEVALDFMFLPLPERRLVGSWSRVAATLLIMGTNNR